MVEEALGDEAEVLAVLLVLLPADLEHGELVLAVDLVTGRMAPHTLGAVPFYHTTTQNIWTVVHVFPHRSFKLSPLSKST